jgi:hypothetical protein
MTAIPAFTTVCSATPIPAPPQNRKAITEARKVGNTDKIKIISRKHEIRESTKKGDSGKRGKKDRSYGLYGEDPEVLPFQENGFGFINLFRSINIFLPS